MKVLVIGGSYFYGRVFVMLGAKEHEITVVNRGTYSMEELGVSQIKGDRHDAALWQQIDENYDAIVDFCAYTPGDIATVFNNLAGRVKQYILISTVDVYRRGTGTVKKEGTLFETRHFPGEAGDYIAGKVALEKEVQEVCGRYQCACTVLRPAILYGPYNYAPRESVFIQMAVQRKVLPSFSDADGRFQFVYVKDAAEAILKCIGNENTYGQAYNLCQDEILDYRCFFEQLRRASGEAPGEIPMTLAEAEAQGMPIPFPATEAETELVSNEKSRIELGMIYTDFSVGIQKTFTAFRHVFEEQGR